jgi:hypothetical protein
MFGAAFEAHTSAGQVLYLFSVYFSLLKPIELPESVHFLRLRYAGEASNARYSRELIIVDKLKCLQMKWPL